MASVSSIKFDDVYSSFKRCLETYLSYEGIGFGNVFDTLSVHYSMTYIGSQSLILEYLHAVQSVQCTWLKNVRGNTIAVKGNPCEHRDWQTLHNPVSYFLWGDSTNLGLVIWNKSHIAVPLNIWLCMHRRTINSDSWISANVYKKG